MNNINKNIKFFVLLFSMQIMAFGLWGQIFFNGFGGARFKALSSPENSSFDANLLMQGFFAGQFSLNEKTILRTEFSIETGDLIENTIFKKTDASFQIDELSITFRTPMIDAINYFSIFAGTYEPIGSDIFLRRQFGIQPITSHITESWLGTAGSIIYPVFGIGIADVIHFINQPISLGGYMYVNKEHENDNVFNFDLRFAGVYRFFAFDIEAGIGAPMNLNSSDRAFIIIDTVFWRAGLNMLIGNYYTNSLFLQAGISDVPFTKSEKEFAIDAEMAYLLVEPRFKNRKFSAHISVFSMPKETVKEFIFIEDTLGANIDIFTDHLYAGSKAFSFGVTGGLFFPDKNFSDLAEPLELLKDYKISAAPYFCTKIYNGTFHAMIKTRISDIIKTDFLHAFEISIAYKTQF